MTGSSPHQEPAGACTPPEHVLRLYAELRRLAQSKLAALPSGGKGLTLQATALVHEAYLRLSNDQKHWSDQGQYFAAAAVAIRDILVERMRRGGRLRHGGGLKRKELSGEVAVPADRQEPQLLELNEAIGRPEDIAPRAAHVVMLRFFAGCSVEQTALALGLSEPTVKREWGFAKAWLYQAVRREEPIDERP